MFKLVKFLIVLVVAVLGAAFAHLNPESVSLSYYFGVLELPLGLLVFMLLGLGILLGVLSSLRGYARLRRENAKLRRRSQLVSDEVNNLRSLPLRER